MILRENMIIDLLLFDIQSGYSWVSGLSMRWPCKRSVPQYRMPFWFLTKEFKFQVIVNYFWQFLEKKWHTFDACRTTFRFIIHTTILIKQGLEGCQFPVFIQKPREDYLHVLIHSGTLKDSKQKKTELFFDKLSNIHFRNFKHFDFLALPISMICAEGSLEKHSFLYKWWFNSKVSMVNPLQLQEIIENVWKTTCFCTTAVMNLLKGLIWRNLSMGLMLFWRWLPCH